MIWVGKLKNKFKDKDLLETALTHRSWVNEHPNERESNERLEFLGDAVLEYIVSSEIFKKFPDKEEGYLTALRASLVNTSNLGSFAKRQNIGQSLYLSKGEEAGGGRENPSLLADCVEAIIGATYLDRGIEATFDFVNENLLKDLPEKTKGPLKDSKSLLQEEVQAKGLTAPKYKVIKESGPDHAKTFVVEVYIKEKPLGEGVGRSKVEAEQEAAGQAIARLSEVI
ncbi:ribonuclease III [Candidatus Woesebacteria bacterium]|nr:ribonuclease III [Candidatus Woesebacteria bacterium]